jgi:hypothetical protein
LDEEEFGREFGDIDKEEYIRRHCNCIIKPARIKEGDYNVTDAWGQSVGVFEVVTGKIGAFIKDEILNMPCNKYTSLQIWLYVEVENFTGDIAVIADTERPIYPVGEDMYLLNKIIGTDHRLGNDSNFFEARYMN